MLKRQKTDGKFYLVSSFYNDTRQNEWSTVHHVTT